MTLRKLGMSDIHIMEALRHRPKIFPHQSIAVYVINRDGKNIGSCGLEAEDLPIDFNFIDGYEEIYTLTDAPVRKYMSNFRRRIKLTKSEDKRKELEYQLKALESADKIAVERRTWTTLSYYT